MLPFTKGSSSISLMIVVSTASTLVFARTTTKYRESLLPDTVVFCMLGFEPSSRVGEDVESTEELACYLRMVGR